MVDTVGLIYTIGLWATIVYAIWIHRKDKDGDGADDLIMLSMIWPFVWMYGIWKLIAR